jgi:ATP synthase protein I
MTDDKPWSRLNSLRVRLGQYRERRHHEDQAVLGTDASSKSAASLAMQVGAELLAAMVAGAGIGWLLDWWLATLPLFFLVFFFLGAGAGMFNVFRRAGEMNRGS